MAILWPKCTKVNEDDEKCSQCELYDRTNQDRVRELTDPDGDFRYSYVVLVFFIPKDVEEQHIVQYEIDLRVIRPDEDAFVLNLIIPFKVKDDQNSWKKKVSCAGWIRN